uniref:Hexosyltransferase n=1 Tax=Heterorhabditis bacteriophora TaxID=37862 RepID=A0A1I7XKD6_HETBA
MEMIFSNNTIPYRILMLPDLSDCQAEGKNMTDQIVVATVLTSAKRYETRMAIRETWAGDRFSSAVKNRKVLVYFVISDSKIRKDMDLLLDEQAIYNDLIVTDLKEAYNNLVYKVRRGCYREVDNPYDNSFPNNNSQSD